MITDHDIFFFDLQGFLHLKGALTKDEVKDLNDGLDSIPRLEPGEWYGHVHSHTYGDRDGRNYQQIYEAGEPFEKLIDHPSWFDKVRHFMGTEGSFDETHGPLFIDEDFANFRSPGEGIGLHNGGQLGISRCQFRFHHGKFHCNQINVIMALTDIGPGDGGTVVVPGAHKGNFQHPDFAKYSMGAQGNCPSQMEGTREVFMEAGDALMFVDCCTHGSANRVNEGERRVIVYRYGPSWGNFRHGYTVSPELLERLTPQRRQIVCPQVPLERSPQRKIESVTS
jgi:hypothetical protein